MNAFGYLVIAIVVVIVGVIFLESFFAKKRNIKLYTFSDSIANLSCGILERIFDFFYAVLFLIASTYLYDNVALVQIPPTILSAAVALLLFDFLAYWHHRWSHEVNFLWAAHIVHHQSEELNLTTVFRVSFFAVINRSFFFILMPLLGFDPFTILICGLTLALYQLFTHSRLIGKLGIIEAFMTTPSHHRVHHGRNEKYMDHNYGHIFIFWDKLFNTFTPEEEEPEYGITTGFESANPYTAQFSYWKNLFTRAGRTKKLSNKLKVFLKGPAWTPEDVEHLPAEYKTDENGKRIHHEIKVKPELGIYILINTLFTFVFFVGLLILKSNAGKGVTLMELARNPYVLTLVGLVLVSVFAHGKMFEKTKTSIFIDGFRLLLVAGSAFILFKDLPVSGWLVPSVLAWCGVMLVWLIKLGVQMKPKTS